MAGHPAADAVPRNLAVCCDGTDNAFGAHNTHVIRLLSAAVRQPGRQWLDYDPGVDTFPAPGALTPLTRHLTMLLGSYGLTRNVGLRCDFPMQHHRPGDRIFVSGFSRGAYTARVLAALLHVCGLLRTGNINLASHAMQMFRAEAVRAKKRNDAAEAGPVVDAARRAALLPPPGSGTGQAPADPLAPTHEELRRPMWKLAQ